MDGILNVYKEADWTSNDVVQKLRGILHTKKIGHGGTLDPMVTGVLPIAVGHATRLLEYMDGAGKEYLAELTLGTATETEDAEGAVIETTPVVENSVSADNIDAVLQQFLGKISQVPPMYSAVKVNGKRLYEYARAGLTVERAAREVEIKGIERVSEVTYADNAASFRFRMACSKGTYVRTLCVDIARELGFSGHMSALTRTMANGLEVADALTLTEIQDVVAEDALTEILQPLSVAVSGLSRKNLSADEMEAVSHGKALSDAATSFSENEKVALFYGNEPVAIYEWHDEQLKAKKVLV